VALKGLTSVSWDWDPEWELEKEVSETMTSKGVEFGGKEKSS